MERDNVGEQGDPEGEFSEKNTMCHLCGNCCTMRENSESFSSDEGNISESLLECDNELDPNGMVGVEFKFRMTQDEIYDCMMKMSQNKKYYAVKLRYTIINILLVILLVVAGVVRNKDIYNWFSLIPFSTILLIWMSPKIVNKRLSRKLSENGQTSICVLKERILVESEGKSREILLNGTSMYEELGDVMVIVSPEGKELMIPERAIEPEYLSEIQATISAGTRPIRR